MKELCTCQYCATAAARYVTPWCELLRGKDSSCAVLHLWYKIDMIREEIDKRTSYLGKLRRAEEAKHLLDLIQLSTDEYDMFVPFAKAAMADIFDILHSYMPKREKAYWWREGRDTIVIDDDESESSDSSDSSEDEPIKFYAGQYVLYNGMLYIALEDGDSDDIAGKLAPTEDYRNSIHYGILWSCGSNINAVEPLDVSVFEALVARIIYKWLQYSYPDEAPRYLEEYNECLAQISRRAHILEGAHIVHRIPRIL